jgi:hypothetical protein
LFKYRSSSFVTSTSSSGKLSKFFGFSPSLSSQQLASNAFLKLQLNNLQQQALLQQNFLKQQNAKKRGSR